MSPTHRIAVASWILAVPLAMAGCSQPTSPEQIEGKTPADYREEAELKAARAVPETPGKAGRSRSR